MYSMMRSALSTEAMVVERFSVGLELGDVDDLSAIAASLHGRFTNIVSDFLKRMFYDAKLASAYYDLGHFVK
jgi:hypothetical protein